MEGKHDRIFDEVMAACKAKHLRDIMAFRKDWNNEIIAQFFATLYVEERYIEISLNDGEEVI
jgi:hypothetical protein